MKYLISKYLIWLFLVAAGFPVLLSAREQTRNFPPALAVPTPPAPRAGFSGFSMHFDQDGDSPSWERPEANPDFALLQDGPPRGRGRGRRGRGQPTPPPRNQRDGPGGGPRDRPAPPFFDRLRNLPPEAQEKALRESERFQKLPQERQERLLDRLRRFQALPPEQRDMIEQRGAFFRQLTPEQRDKVREMYFKHWRTLPPERQKIVMEEFRKLREMSPDEKERYLARPEMEGRFNADERELLHELGSFPVPPPRRGPPPPDVGPRPFERDRPDQDQ